MFKRNLYQKLIKEIYSDFYLIVTGARQVGKTTLLKQVFDFLKENNHLVFFLNLENPDYLKLLNEHPRNIFRIY
ncbi:MAG: AAA family ATPase, partial [Actinobacteria bacterium]|nr:AAA family ATPase [Actinomycetota bacterium]